VCTHGAALGQLPPLHSGSVTSGHTAHGFIGYGCNLCSNHDLFVKMIDPDTENPLYPGPFAVVEAGWKVHA
jgi:hypothetical protein